MPAPSVGVLYNYELICKAGTQFLKISSSLSRVVKWTFICWKRGQFFLSDKGTIFFVGQGDTFLSDKGTIIVGQGDNYCRTRGHLV